MDGENLWICLCLFSQYTGVEQQDYDRAFLVSFEIVSLENSILRSRAVLLRMVALGTAMTKNRLMHLISNLTPYS